MSTPTGRTRSDATPPTCAAGPSADRRGGDRRHRCAARPRRRRLLLQPAVAERRRALCAARRRRQRLLERRVDHRRQADACGPRADPGGVRARRRDDLRQRRAPGHDEHWSAWCSAAPASGWTRSGSPSRWTARPTSPPDADARWGSRQAPDTPGLAESVRRESEVFAESAAMMADAMGVTLDRMTFDVEFTAGHRRHRPRLHADPGRDGRRRARLPPRLGRGPQRGQRRLQLDHGPSTSSRPSRWRTGT